ncbi:MAG: hypothetical protein KUL86_14205 [Castellaniella sp.]|nr:hypothetical protein [Castellaniella sp.]
MSIPWGATMLAIALFRSCEPMGRDECPQAPAGWWGELFSEQTKEARISLSAQRMLPYPQAIEAGRCMLAVINREPSPQDLFFLRPDEEASCARDARLFQ